MLDSPVVARQNNLRIMDDHYVTKKSSTMSFIFVMSTSLLCLGLFMSGFFLTRRELDSKSSCDVSYDVLATSVVSVWTHKWFDFFFLKSQYSWIFIAKENFVQPNLSRMRGWSIFLFNSRLVLSIEWTLFLLLLVLTTIEMLWLNPLHALIRPMCRVPFIRASCIIQICLSVEHP